MTNDAVWDPYDNRFAEDEDALRASLDNVVHYSPRLLACCVYRKAVLTRG